MGNFYRSRSLQIIQTRGGDWCVQSQGFRNYWWMTFCGTSKQHFWAHIVPILIWIFCIRRSRVGAWLTLYNFAGIYVSQWNRSRRAWIDWAWQAHKLIRPAAGVTSWSPRWLITRLYKGRRDWGWTNVHHRCLLFDPHNLDSYINPVEFLVSIVLIWS